MTRGSDDRSRQAIAYSWASRVISISLEMVVPGAIGVWLDKRFGTVAVFTVLGFSLGLVLGIIHLLQISKSQQPDGQHASTGRRSSDRSGFHTGASNSTSETSSDVQSKRNSATQENDHFE